MQDNIKSKENSTILFATRQNSPKTASIVSRRMSISPNKRRSLLVPRGSVMFDLQLGRDKAKDSIGSMIGKGAHEKRFEYVEKPSKYVGNYKEPCSPVFAKMKPRDNILLLRNLHLHDYPVRFNPSISGLIELKKMRPRESMSPEKPKLMPEEYPKEKVDSGFLRLGHVRRVSAPTMEKMSPRNNKMYYINEFQNLDPPKDITKFKGLIRQNEKSSARSNNTNIIKIHKVD